MNKVRAKLLNKPIEREYVNVIEGRPLVELNELANNLFCNNLDGQQDILLTNCVGEEKLGLNSILKVRCDKCSFLSHVYTGKVHKTEENSLVYDVNIKIVLSALHAGIGVTALNKILACANAPTLSSNLFKRYEREVGPAIEKSAKSSCKQAAKLEQKLVIGNVEKLCEELPQKISQDIFKELKSMTISERERLLENSDSDVCTRVFDNGLGQIIHIIVSYDMGWSKRGCGWSYDSLNGYACIIGFLSGKIIDYSTRNRMCRRCEINKKLGKADAHDCRLNFQGSAKAMEAHVGDSLINSSNILKETGLNVRVMIGDDDSSTISAVRSGAAEEIHKLSDTNHLKKHFTNDLFSLQKDYPEMRKPGVIPHLKKCFSYAVAQNKGKSEQLGSTLRAIPDHVFNRHENCNESWCHHSGDNTNDIKPTIVLNDEALYGALYEVFGKYARNSSKFSIQASSQANEATNNIMAHQAPKNNCYSLSESADYRYAITVCVKNDGEKYITEVPETLSVSPGKLTASCVQKRTEQKLRRAQITAQKKFKCRRKLLKEKRTNLRKTSEQKEGTQYESNSGLGININEIFDNIENNDETPTADTCKIVYFDLETTGFSNSSSIVQIAAKTQGRCFSVYARPTQVFTPEASAATDLQYHRNNVLLNGKIVESMSIVEALESFKQFLCTIPEPSILLAHNVSFDKRILIHTLLRYSLLNNFQSIIAGFADSKSLLQATKDMRGRKGKGQFKLYKLAEDFLPPSNDHQFHEALYDVKILEELVEKFIDEDSIINKTELFSTSVKKILGRAKKPKNDAPKKKKIPKDLADLKNVISPSMIKKIVAAELTYAELLECYTQKGELALKE